MPFDRAYGTPAEWETYVSGLKALNTGLQRAGVENGVWDERSRPFRRGLQLTSLPYAERLTVVRDAWHAALTDEERMEVGPEGFGKPYAGLEVAWHGAAPWLSHWHSRRYGKFAYAGSLRGADEYSQISGLKADMIIIDDPINDTARKTKVKKPKPKTYNTVGVRFLRGHNLAKVYTYKVPKKTKLQLGEEVVVPSTFDGLTTNGIGVVVELHKEPQDTGPHNYVFVTGRIARIAV